MARELGTSRASVNRALARLEGLALVTTKGRGQLVLHSLSLDSPLVGPLFEMFNHERYMSVRPKTREVLERMMNGIDTDGLRCVILFGSQARGTAGEMSDIDMCFVRKGGEREEGFQSKVRDLAYPYVLVEPHCYYEDEFAQVPDLVVLDSILHGISLHGHRYLLSTRHGLESVRKEVLLARLEGCRRLLEEATAVMGAAREHFEAMVEMGLAEIESVLHEGTTLTKADVHHRGDLEARMKLLSKELEGEDERVWVT
jgi:predicted nucleotidyltransferase